MGDTKVQQDARRRAIDVRRSIGQAIRRLREDGGISRRGLGLAAGFSAGYVRLIEEGDREASIEALAAIGLVLGADVSVRLFPTTGPVIHDRTQAPMEGALLRVLHRRWLPSPEVVVSRPARGVIDLALDDPRDGVLVATELQSRIERLEQQIRWHREKEESLPSSQLWRFATAGGATSRTTSRLLVLRSTQDLRSLARTCERTLAAVYPARTADALASLRGEAAWPGPAIVWMRVEAGVALLMDGPPRGLRLGR
jgi:transcriptional regulator with XRE-family HTH domain